MEPLQPHGLLSSLSYSPTSFSAELFSPRNLDLSRRSEKYYENLESQEGVPEPTYLLSQSSLQAMLKKEATAYRGQCLQGPDIDDQSRVLSWFRSMVTWSYMVVDCCEVPPQVVDVTFSLLDRFLICNGLLSNQCDILSHSVQFQMVVMTCLYIATKTVSSLSLAPTFFQRTSRGEILAEDIEATEMVILFDLDFQINPPTIVSLAQAYAQEQLQLWNFDTVDPSEEEKEQRALFMHLVEKQARLAISELYTLSNPVSAVALACVQNALDIMENYQSLPKMDTTLKETAFDIAMLNLQAKVRKSSIQRKPDFESQQDQLQSSLLIVALQAFSTRKNSNKEE